MHTLIFFQPSRLLPLIRVLYPMFFVLSFVTASYDLVTITDSPKAYIPVVLVHAGNIILLNEIMTNIP